MSKSTPAGKNVTAVQVPGASAPAAGAIDNKEPEAGAGTAEAGALAGSGAAAPAMTEEATAALRAENDDLRAQIEAAGRQRAPGKGDAPQAAPISRTAYLNMRAEDVDPNTLTKAVLTKDGWVCPPKLVQTQPK